jgi:plastocyanin
MLAAAPSKVPFYIAGGVLACWAVLLAAWGIRHHDFPGSKRGGRLVMLFSALLVVTTMTAAVLTAGEGEEAAAGEGEGGGGGAPPATGRTVAIAADPSGSLEYVKKDLGVLAGQVTINFTNDSPVEHNVTIEQGSRELGATKTITHAKDSLSVDLPAGRYVFFCSVPGHREAGMEGFLTSE